MNMRWRLGQTKTEIRVAAAFLLLYVTADIYLYFVLQNEHVTQINVNPTTSSSLPPILCYDTNIKSLMLDHNSYYIQHPLAVFINRIFSIAENFPLITPNMISISHIFVAFFSARCVKNKSLTMRRMGVFLFQVRNFLDTFDGVLARARKNIRISISEVGSLGFYMEAICDGLGGIFLLLACVIFLNDNLPKYTLLPPVKKDKKGDLMSNIKSMLNIHSTSVLLVFIFTIQLLIGGLAWNRYIWLYHNALEKNPSTLGEMLVAEQAKKSTATWIIFWLWRVLNSQTMVEVLLAAIIFNKMFAFFNSLKYFGIVSIIILITLTEIHVYTMNVYLKNN